MSEQAPEFNLDALLDGTLEDLADLPEFKPYPPGAHIVIMSPEFKKVNNHPCYEIGFKYVEAKELPAGIESPAKDATSSVLYMMDSEIGQGQLKKMLIAAAEKFGAKSNRELLEDCKNAEVLILTGLRQNKDKTQTYLDVKEYSFL